MIHNLWNRVKYFFARDVRWRPEPLEGDPDYGWSEDQREHLLQIDKKWAAIRQTETAIWLWFDYGDPVSIHTLSKASNDLLATLSEVKGKRTSILKTWLDGQPPRIQKFVSKVDNYFKHGYRDINEDLDFLPFYSEIVLMDSADCCTFLYGRATPMMRLFWTRFMVCNRDLIAAEELDPLIVQATDMYGLDRVSRREFFNKLWPTFQDS